MKPDRLTNFTYISERDELPWLRPEDFRDIELERPVVLINGAFRHFSLRALEDYYSCPAKSGHSRLCSRLRFPSV